MRYFADLHIHSVLSPCADFLMTVENILKKLKENNIKIFSITDHNSCGNSKIFKEKAEKEGFTGEQLDVLRGNQMLHTLNYF